MAKPTRVPAGRPCLAGFTLIELVVSIAILTMLMALLLPVLSRTRESMRRTTDLANLRNWHWPAFATRSRMMGCCRWVERHTTPQGRQLHLDQLHQLLEAPGVYRRPI